MWTGSGGWLSAADPGRGVQRHRDEFGVAVLCGRRRSVYALEAIRHCTLSNEVSNEKNSSI